MSPLHPPGSVPALEDHHVAFEQTLTSLPTPNWEENENHSLPDWGCKGKPGRDGGSAQKLEVGNSAVGLGIAESWVACELQGDLPGHVGSKGILCLAKGGTPDTHWAFLSSPAFRRVTEGPHA